MIIIKSFTFSANAAYYKINLFIHLVCFISLLNENRGELLAYYYYMHFFTFLLEWTRVASQVWAHLVSQRETIEVHRFPTTS